MRGIIPELNTDNPEVGMDRNSSRSHQLWEFCAASWGKRCLSPFPSFFPFISRSLPVSPSAQNFGNCADDLGFFPAFLFSSPGEELDFGSVSLALFLPAAKIPFWSHILGRKEYILKGAHGNSGLIVFTPEISGLLPLLDDSCPASKYSTFLKPWTRSFNDFMVGKILLSVFLSLFFFYGGWGGSWRSSRGFCETAPVTSHSWHFSSELCPGNVTHLRGGFEVPWKGSVFPLKTLLE